MAAKRNINPNKAQVAVVEPWLIFQRLKVSKNDNLGWTTVTVGVQAPRPVRVVPLQGGETEKKYACLIQTGEKSSQHDVFGFTVQQALFHALLAVDLFLAELSATKTIMLNSRNQYEPDFHGLVSGPYLKPYLKRHKTLSKI